MKDEQILLEIKEFFCIEEFVSEKVFKKYGEDSWQFISIRLLETILIIRKELDSSITINNWKWGGKFSQRGLRENTSSMVSKKTSQSRIYLSAHVTGSAIDFDVKGMSAENVRKWIVGHSELFPYKLRLENLMKGKQISWIHLDVYSLPKNEKVHLFNV